MTRTQRLDEIARVAVDFERRTQYPAAVVVAQWAVESGWGERMSGKNNPFGMTYRPRHSGFSWVTTREELTARQIAALDREERETITRKTPIPTRPGFFNITLRRRFADYPNLLAAVEDKVSLIMTSPRYAAAWSGYLRNRSVPDFIDAIAAAGYATAGNYMTLVKQIAAQRNVQSAIQQARTMETQNV
jgi:flagellum-specific peptidoglycan hydrolase FlgJ